MASSWTRTRCVQPAALPASLHSLTSPDGRRQSLMSHKPSTAVRNAAASTAASHLAPCRCEPVDCTAYEHHCRTLVIDDHQEREVEGRVSTQRPGRRSRLRPAGTLIVTRIRPPAVIRTARVTVLFADLRGYT